MARAQWLARLAGLGSFAALAALLALLFAKTQGYDESRYFENVARLREIAHLDAHWELEALHSRIGLNNNYDPVAAPLPQLERLQAELASQVDARAPGEPTALGQSVAALSRVIAEKARLMEHFKSHDAVLHNSLAFLPVAVGDLRRAARESPAGAAGTAQRMVTRADAVLLAAFIHVQQGGDEGAAEIDSALVQLAAEAGSQAAAVGDAVDLLASHVRTALREHAAVSGLLNRIAAVPMDAHIDAVDRLLSGRHLMATAEDQRYRRYLLAFAALLTGLLVAAGFALTRSHGLIRRVNRQLQEANDNLEQRVQERTRELDAAQAELVATARQAGMAEIATNVLHNVGNVLNSVNVSAGLVAGQVRASKAGGLARAAQMLNEHAADLGDFLSRDEKGKRLPEYLHKLAETLAAEQGRILDEMGQLAKSVDHIKDIVATQQSYAGASRLVEPVDVRDLVDDALRMNAGSLVRHDVSVIKDIGEVPVLPLDRHRVLQILVNLIGNAKQAMDATTGRPHRMTLRVAMVDGEAGRCLQICVADEGEGISAANLARIFTHGFTTRKNGHGFGLHSCALAAREMGGTLRAQSAGPGLGAAFTLELPVNAQGNAA